MSVPTPLYDGTRMFRFAMNNLGQVAFVSRLRNTSSQINDMGIYLGDGNSIVQIARNGQQVGIGTVGIGFPDAWFQLQLNDAGLVAFRTFGGIFRGDGSSLELVAHVGQTLPDSTGEPLGPFRYFQMNNSGRLTFLADISNDVGIFQWDGNEFRLLVRTGQSAPDGNGELDLLYTRSFAFNDAGQIAFIANVKNASPQAHQGLFLYDQNDGLIQVARTGQEYMGSWFNAFALSTHDADNLEGLNNRGQIAYRFQLYDRREGIALWTPVPEPSSVMMLIAISVALCFIVRSRRNA